MQHINLIASSIFKANKISCNTRASQKTEWQFVHWSHRQARKTTCHTQVRILKQWRASCHWADYNWRLRVSNMEWERGITTEWKSKTDTEGKGRESKAKRRADDKSIWHAHGHDLQKSTVRNTFSSSSCFDFFLCYLSAKTAQAQRYQ